MKTMKLCLLIATMLLAYACPPVCKVLADEAVALRFAAIGCGPYSVQEEEKLASLIEQENAAGVSEFMVHLGDIMSGATPGTEPRYSRVASLLQQSENPVFVVPGDNEWNDQADPELAWDFWKQYFMHFDKRWDGSDEPFTEPSLRISGVRRQDVRPENFSFVRKGILCIGINLPGGTLHDADEWATRLPQNATWIKDNFDRSEKNVHAAIVFAQAALSDANTAFFMDFRAAAEKFSKPVLYLHADGHRWIKDQPWPEKNMLRVQTDQLGIAEPLLVSVMAEGDGVDVFQFDRRLPKYQRGPYLAAGGSRQVTIVWRGEGEGKPEVRIGKRSDKLKRRIRSEDILQRQADGKGAPESLSAAPEGAVQYEAEIDGLKRDTRYYYGIFEGDVLVAGGDADHWFRTNPKVGPSHPFRFWVVGDSGSGAQSQRDVHTAMLNHVAQDGTPLDFLMHVGDMAYGSGTDDEFHRNFFAPYATTLRNTVCWPTMGNHEGISSSGKSGVGPYYDSYVLPARGEFGGTASGTEAYYSFNYANAHFVCLDSHDLDRSAGGEMAVWLKKDLSANASDWIIAYWHHPPYTKGTHDSDVETQLIEMRESIMPILEDAGVDIVFTGHSHIYERSMLMDGAYATPTVAENVILDDGDGHPDGDGAYRKSEGLMPHEGTVQVVTGHGGAGVGRLGTMPVMRSVHVEHGSIIVDVDDDHLTAVMINDEGLQRDLFRLIKKGRVVPTRIAQPWTQPSFVNWGRVAATVTLPTSIEPGKPIEISLRIAAIPMDEAHEGRLEWKTEGTSWSVVPASAVFTIKPNEETVLKAMLTYEKTIFPLANPNLVVITADGNQALDGKMVMPPYKRTTVHQMAARPTIDGVLDAAELSGLTRGGGMIEYGGSGPAKFGTKFYLGLFEDHLYIGLKNDEPEMSKLKLRNNKRDGALWLDNCNEMFIQLEGEGRYYQVIVDSSGQVFDGSLGTGGEGSSWNWDISTAAKLGDKAWSAEVLIAPGMFGRALKPGDKLRLNITRTNPVHDEMSQWSHTYGTGQHQPEHFGTATVE